MTNSGVQCPVKVDQSSEKGKTSNPSSLKETIGFHNVSNSLDYVIDSAEFVTFGKSLFVAKNYTVDPR